MPVHNSMVRFKYGSKADFNSLAFKDPNTLYFCTDTQEIYLGSVKYNESGGGGGSSEEIWSTEERKVGTFFGEDLYEISLAEEIEVPNNEEDILAINFDLSDKVSAKNIFIESSYLFGFSENLCSSIPVPFCYAELDDPEDQKVTQAVLSLAFSKDETALYLNISKDMLSNDYDAYTFYCKLRYTKDDSPVPGEYNIIFPDDKVGFNDSYVYGNIERLGALNLNEEIGNQFTLTLTLNGSTMTSIAYPVESAGIYMFDPGSQFAGITIFDKAVYSGNPLSLTSNDNAFCVRAPIQFKDMAFTINIKKN